MESHWHVSKWVRMYRATLDGGTVTSEKRLSPFQGLWGNLQQASFTFLGSAGVLWACAVLFCLVCSFAQPAAAQIAPDVTVAKDGSSAATTIASPVFSTAR